MLQEEQSTHVQGMSRNLSHCPKRKGYIFIAYFLSILTILGYKCYHFLFCETFVVTLASIVLQRSIRRIKTDSMVSF